MLLPNPKLLRCQAADCNQLWVEKSEAQNTVSPKQLVIDTNEGCVYGMTALYDKSVPAEDIRAAINERYEKWAVHGLANPSFGVWRVESERFAIQLSTNSKKDERRNIAEAGTKQALYIAFGGRFACKTL